MSGGYLESCVILLLDTENSSVIFEAYKYTVKPVGQTSSGQTDLAQDAEDMLENLQTIYKTMDNLPKNYNIQYVIKLNQYAPPNKRVSNRTVKFEWPFYGCRFVRVVNNDTRIFKNIYYFFIVWRNDTKCRICKYGQSDRSVQECGQYRIPYD